MSHHVKVTSPEAKIKEAAQKMRDGDFRMMPVGEGDRMIGAISDRDIAIGAVGEGKDPTTKVRDTMSEGILWVHEVVHEDDSVDDAARIMSEKQILRLPVVDRDRRLMGIVALADFVVQSSDIEPAAEALIEVSQPK
jgi:CBS domain-containing protein